MLFLCYSRCSTCKKAQKCWMNRASPTPSGTSRRTTPPCRSWKPGTRPAPCPLKKFFNTSGQLYRALSLSKKLPDMTQAEQYALLASDGMLVKRPILVLEDGRVLVGFQQDQWAEALG